MLGGSLSLTPSVAVAPISLPDFVVLMEAMRVHKGCVGEGGRGVVSFVKSSAIEFGVRNLPRKLLAVNTV